QVVSSGGVASGTVIRSYGSQTILSGGVASGTVISSGGAEYVSSGGVASGTVVSSGGAQYIGGVYYSAGGLAVGTVVSSGGIGYVYSGNTASNTVLRGGTLVVSSGGRVSGIDLTRGGVVDLRGIGGATSYTISAGTFNLFNSSGGVLSSFSVSGYAQSVSIQGDGYGGTSIIASTAIAPRLDFDGNGRADLVWQNAQGGLTLWSMNGAQATATFMGDAGSTDWRPAGFKDFSGDGKAD
ncbi:hypothetical protein GAY29_32075, partial [Azospirillum brasilense]|uniref:FG-GAP repeat domain-containing protein n=1 Tax=Azospirillum brasilense TaxID=192 RepID=UPI00190BDCBC